jgi:hypothetical protein
MRDGESLSESVPCLVPYTVMVGVVNAWLSISDHMIPHSDLRSFRLAMLPHRHLQLDPHGYDTGRLFHSTYTQHAYQCRAEPLIAS